MSNAIKIIAAILVMLSHYSQYICTNHHSPSIVFLALSSQGGYLGVAFFFFLSGFGLMESEKKAHLSAFDFFKKRLLKIYLPVLLVTLLWGIVSSYAMSISPFEVNDSMSVGGGIIRRLWCFGDGVLWFVKVLLILYLLFFLFSIFYDSHRQIAIVSLFLTSIILSMAIRLYSEDFQAISVPFFSLGVFMSLYKGMKSQLEVLILSVICISLIWCKIFDMNIMLHFIINASFLTLFVIMLTVKYIDFKVPSIIGAISFDIYLVHNKVIMAMKESVDYIPLWLFILITAISTYVFFTLRKRILKV